MPLSISDSYNQTQLGDDQTKPGDVFLIPLMKVTFLSGFTSIKGCLLGVGFRSWTLSISPAYVRLQKRKIEQLGKSIAKYPEKKYKGLKQTSKA